MHQPSCHLGVTVLQAAVCVLCQDGDSLCVPTPPVWAGPWDRLLVRRGLRRIQVRAIGQQQLLNTVLVGSRVCQLVVSVKQTRTTNNHCTFHSKRVKTTPNLTSTALWMRRQMTNRQELADFAKVCQPKQGLHLFLPPPLDRKSTRLNSSHL